MGFELLLLMVPHISHLILHKSYISSLKTQNRNSFVPVVLQRKIFLLARLQFVPHVEMTHQHARALQDHINEDMSLEVFSILIGRGI